MASTTIEKLKAKLARRATVIEVGNAGAPADAAMSWFGRVDVGLPGEGWPTDGGRPMVPIAQINLCEAPFVPTALDDIELIAVFFGQGEFETDAPNGNGWLVRAYPRVDALAVLETPVEARGAASAMFASQQPLRPRPIRYRVLEHDFPDWDDVADTDIPERIADAWEDHFGAADGCKLGGWPKLIQSEIFWGPDNIHAANPEYVFQLDMVPAVNFVFHEESVCYFGRGTGTARDVWTFAWQCY